MLAQENQKQCAEGWASMYVLRYQSVMLTGSLAEYTQMYSSMEHWPVLILSNAKKMLWLYIYFKVY